MGSQNLSEGLNSFMIPGDKYGYTGTPVDSLQSFENTIAIGLVDESGSTTSFAQELEKCVKEVIKSLKDSEHADKLLYAHYHFDTNFREVHGFKEVININVSDYDGCWSGGGCTALYDSEVKVIKYIDDYSKQLASQRYLCNGLFYILTDGKDYGSTLNENSVKTELSRIVTNENLESFVTILIGINEDDSVQKGLESHAKECGFTRYIKAKNANRKTLSKISGFISQSISSQSQALGSGGPSQSLTF